LPPVIVTFSRVIASAVLLNITRCPTHVWVIV
jgi:hypothetical protein